MLADETVRLPAWAGPAVYPGIPGTTIAPGESVIKYTSPLNVLKDTYDYSCCLARSDEYNHLMTDSPWARHGPRPAPGLRDSRAPGGLRVAGCLGVLVRARWSLDLLASDTEVLFCLCSLCK